MGKGCCCICRTVAAPSAQRPGCEADWVGGRLGLEPKPSCRCVRTCIRGDSWRLERLRSDCNPEDGAACEREGASVVQYETESHGWQMGI